MKNNHKCAAWWLIDSQNVGECLKLYPDKDLIVCGDTGKPCPYDGIKDFGERIRKAEKAPIWMREKASKGGKRSHG